MGLIADLALTRVHVLVVGVPGFPLLRLRAAAAVRARGWVLAASPADADLLLVCGEATGELADAVARVWAQVPAPRARRTLHDAGAIREALESAARVLHDDRLQRETALARVRNPDADAPAATPALGHGSAGPGAHDEHEHAAHGHGAAEPSAHDEHEHPHEHGADAPHEHEHAHGADAPDAHGHDAHGHSHGHGSMSMEGPAGIPLATGWEGDRDGLEMDVLRLRLGPVLTDWPAGLVLDLTLSGDVVVGAEATLPSGGAEVEAAGVDRSTADFVLAADRAAVALRIAGWPGPAARLDRAIDDVLGGVPPADRRRVLRLVARLIARSAALRWSTAGSDARARLLVLLGDAERAAFGEPPVDRVTDAADLTRAVLGRTLGEARFAVAVAGRMPAPEAVDA